MTQKSLRVYSPNDRWKTLERLVHTASIEYSVTDADAFKHLYYRQLKQYPLYAKWEQFLLDEISQCRTELRVLSYGPGPGIIEGKVVALENVAYMRLVEPDNFFRQLSAKSIEDSLSFAGRRTSFDVIEGTAETYRGKGQYDVIMHTATGHHFPDKKLAYQNHANALRPGGRLVMTDVMLPEYAFDSETLEPNDLNQFFSLVLSYIAEQIRGMPDSGNGEVADQIKTAFQDVLNTGEHKVCLPVVIQCLEEAGFYNIQTTLFTGQKPGIDWTRYGWWGITADKT
ncbi:MAG: class I SAM-dependent methyltransferase [archaeon]